MHKSKHKKPLGLNPYRKQKKLNKTMKEYYSPYSKLSKSYQLDTHFKLKEMNLLEFNSRNSKLNVDSLIRQWNDDTNFCPDYIEFDDMALTNKSLLENNELLRIDYDIRINKSKRSNKIKQSDVLNRIEESDSNVIGNDKDNDEKDNYSKEKFESDTHNEYDEDFNYKGGDNNSKSNKDGVNEMNISSSRQKSISLKSQSNKKDASNNDKDNDNDNGVNKSISKKSIINDSDKSIKNKSKDNIIKNDNKDKERDKPQQKQQKPKEKEKKANNILNSIKDDNIKPINPKSNSSHHQKNNNDSYRESKEKQYYATDCVSNKSKQNQNERPTKTLTKTNKALKVSFFEKTNDKVLLDDFAQKTFSNININGLYLSYSIENDYGAVYDLLFYSAIKVAYIQRYWKKHQLNRILNKSRKLVACNWDSNQRYVVFVFADKYDLYNRIEDFFIRVYSIDKMKSVFDTLSIEDLIEFGIITDQLYDNDKGKAMPIEALNKLKPAFFDSIVELVAFQSNINTNTNTQLQFTTSLN